MTSCATSHAPWVLDFASGVAERSAVISGTGFQGGTCVSMAGCRMDEDSLVLATGYAREMDRRRAESDGAGGKEVVVELLGGHDRAMQPVPG